MATAFLSSFCSLFKEKKRLFEFGKIIIDVEVTKLNILKKYTTYKVTIPTLAWVVCVANCWVLFLRSVPGVCSNDRLGHVVCPLHD
jgi:hypothetical protein